MQRTLLVTKTHRQPQRCRPATPTSSLSYVFKPFNLSPHVCSTIIKNKWEHVSDRALDFVLDHLNTLNDLTPKIRCKGRSGVDPNLIFGLETSLFCDDNPT